MLVLSRRVGERIEIGNGVTVTVLRMSGKSVRIGIEAPNQVAIRRSEIPGKSDLPQSLGIADVEGRIRNSEEPTRRAS